MGHPVYIDIVYPVSQYKGYDKKKLGTIKFWSKKLRLEKNMVQKNVGSKKFGVQNKLVWGNSENIRYQTS